MPLKLGGCLFCAVLSVACPARASGDQSGAPPKAANDRLVPLVELKSRKYEKAWFADFQVHDLSLGLSVSPIELSGEVSVPADPAQGGQGRTEPISGTIPFGGIYAAYYLPLVGYSPNFSVGLLPELHAGIGAVGDNLSQTSSVISDGDDELGTVLRAPLFLMARLGYNASRYGNWGFAANLGFGPVLLRVNTGNPALGTVTYVAPGARASVAFHAFELGLETEVARHDDFSSSSEAIRVSYLGAALTLSLRFAPNSVE